MTPDIDISKRTLVKAIGSVGAVGAFGGIASARTDGVDPRKLIELRRATAKYHDLDKALADGYILPEDHCVSHPDPSVGAMGYHYVMPSLIDGSVDHTQPEVLVYEQRGNNRHLVAVEFLATGANPPSLFGHEFHAAPPDVPANWALHVWAWKNNPSGLLADFNPKVSCPD